MKLSCVQSRFALFALVCVVGLQMSPPVSARAGNRESKILTVIKKCGEATATLQPGELDYCTILESNFPALRGAKIRYFGPGFFAPNHPFLDSWVVIESDRAGEGTAFGHCLVRGVPDVLGACQFTGGSGSLRGFHADVTVTTAGGGIWHWNGAVSDND
jgi:hypothetical protein